MKTIRINVVHLALFLEILNVLSFCSLKKSDNEAYYIKIKEKCFHIIKQLVKNITFQNPCTPGQELITRNKAHNRLY